MLNVSSAGIKQKLRVGAVCMYLFHSLGDKDITPITWKLVCEHRSASLNQKSNETRRLAVAAMMVDFASPDRNITQLLYSVAACQCLLSP